MHCLDVAPFPALVWQERDDNSRGHAGVLQHRLGLREQGQGRLGAGRIGEVAVGHAPGDLKLGEPFREVVASHDLPVDDEQRFGIESLFVSTMQAVSGAGYPGVPSLDILGNVVPFVKNEEEKMQEEIGKLLGRYTGSAVEVLPAKVSAHCNIAKAPCGTVAERAEDRRCSG